MSNARRILGYAVLPVAAIVLLFFLSPSHSLSNRVLIFAIATTGLTFLYGQAGLLSIGQGIFFGAGAYAAGLAILHWHVGPLAAIVLGMLAGAVLALAIGLLCVRRSGIYFVLLTFAFAEMFGFLVYAFSGLTGGENGLLGVGRPAFGIGGQTIFDYSSATRMYLLVGIIYVLVYIFLKIVSESRFGSVLRGIRENERRTRFLGYSPNTFKVLAFTISGAITGLAGVLFSLLVHSVPPSVMQMNMSLEIFMMAIIGGGRYLFGSFIGALVYVVLSVELSYIWPRWAIILGVVLIGIVFLKKASQNESGIVQRMRTLVTPGSRSERDGKNNTEGS